MLMGIDQYLTVWREIPESGQVIGQTTL